MVTQKRALENYYYFSPSLQPPPALQMAAEDHLLTIVAGLGVLFVWLLGDFFWMEKGNKKGTLLLTEGKGVEILGFCLLLLFVSKSC